MVALAMRGGQQLQEEGKEDDMRKIIAGLAWVALAAAPSGAAVLENPTAGRPYSGIGVI